MFDDDENEMDGKMEEIQVCFIDNPVSRWLRRVSSTMEASTPSNKLSLPLRRTRWRHMCALLPAAKSIPSKKQEPCSLGDDRSIFGCNLENIAWDSAIVNTFTLNTARCGARTDCGLWHCGNDDAGVPIGNSEPLHNPDPYPWLAKSENFPRVDKIEPPTHTRHLHSAGCALNWGILPPNGGLTQLEMSADHPKTSRG